MKFRLALALFVSWDLASAVPRPERKITYDGYKAFRISTHHDAASVKQKLAPLAAVPFNLDTDEHLDVAISPEAIAAFEALGFETEVMHEDLGADIVEEGTFAPYDGKTRHSALYVRTKLTYRG
jgi:carboxypeptidase A4